MVLSTTFPFMGSSEISPCNHPIVLLKLWNTIERACTRTGVAGANQAEHRMACFNGSNTHIKRDSSASADKEHYTL